MGLASASRGPLLMMASAALTLLIGLLEIFFFCSLRRIKTHPVGVCKGSVVPFVNIVLIMKIYDCMSCFGSVSPFQPRGSLVLYADRPRSSGRLQPSLVCQVAMPWSRPGGERPEVQSELLRRDA